LHQAVVEFAPLLLSKFDQCIGPGLQFGDSPIPARNCGSVSSDVHVLDRRVRILYESMFYIQGAELREQGRHLMQISEGD
jgi:hypothetical protein